MEKTPKVFSLDAHDQRKLPRTDLRSREEPDRFAVDTAIDNMARRAYGSMPFEQ